MKKIAILLMLSALLMPFSNFAQKKVSPTKAVKKTSAGASVKKNPNSMPRQAFIIQSIKNYGMNPGGCWDIPGHPGGKDFKKGQNIQVWNIDQGPDRFYVFRKIYGTPYYNIHVGNSMNYVVDLSGNKTHNGSNIHIWEKNGSDAQKFYVEHQGNGVYKIKHISGKVLCLAGRDNKNGSNVHLWDDHTIPATQWVFLDATSKRIWRP
jgi:hypothetical protein